jgi:hypothetical protein
VRLVAEIIAQSCMNPVSPSLSEIRRTIMCRKYPQGMDIDARCSAKIELVI